MKRRRVIISDSEEEEDDRKPLPVDNVDDDDDIEVDEEGEGQKNGGKLMTSTPARAKIAGGKTAKTTVTAATPGGGKMSEMSRSFLASFRANEVCNFLTLSFSIIALVQVFAYFSNSVKGRQRKYDAVLCFTFLKIHYSCF